MNTSSNNRFRVFSVKYLPATNTKHARVKITDERHEVSKTIPYDYDCRDSYELAEKFLAEKSILVNGLAMGKNDCFLLSEDFTTKMI